jgi:phage shock protein A
MNTCYDSAMSENDRLINFIANTVEGLRQRVDAISEQMATKVDLANLRDEMRTELAAVKDQMVTKDELAEVKAQMATKDDLAALRIEMATKNDLGRLETTMRGEFEQVHLRLDSIDRRVDTRIGQVETDVSRLRSVVYLLVKDKPDMLRLLGRPDPGESRPQG